MKVDGNFWVKKAEEKFDKIVDERLKDKSTFYKWFRRSKSNRELEKQSFILGYMNGVVDYLKNETMEEMVKRI